MVASVFYLSNFSYMFFILKAQRIFTGANSIEVSILLYVIFNVFYALFAIPLGLLADKIGRKRVILSGYFLFSLTCLGFLFLESIVSLIALFICYGLTYALIEGNQRAYVSDLSADYIRATALGAFHTITSIMMLFSSIVAGILWTFSSDYTFMYGSAMSFLSILLFFMCKRRFRENK